VEVPTWQPDRWQNLVKLDVEGTRKIGKYVYSSFQIGKSVYSVAVFCSRNFGSIHHM